MHLRFTLLILLAAVAHAAAQTGKIYHDGHGEFVYFPLGIPSFADEVVSVTPGNPSTTFERFKDKKNILGEPNYNIETVSNVFSLGCRGSVTVRFTNNALIDIEGPDLYVFEVGSNIEPTRLEISENGTAWIDVGQISGGRAQVDIHDYVKPGQVFYYVRLTDLGTGCDDNFPGAEIDAVGAIGSVTSFSLSSAVLFDVGQSTLKTGAKLVLDSIVTGLKTYGDYTIRVDGHTDADGEEATNQSLSLKRSQAVKTYLISKGISSKKIIAAGYGETLPVGDNTTEEGKKLNRRVNLLIIPSVVRPYFEEEHNTLMMVMRKDQEEMGEGFLGGKWMGGFPKPVNAASFPGVWIRDLDEVVRIGEKIYFFHRDSVACLDRNTRKMEPGFPQPVSRAFPGLWADGVDASWVDYTEGKVFFVHRGEIAVWNVSTASMEAGTPMPLAGTNWEAKLPRDLTAAYQVGNVSVFLFAGGNFYFSPFGYRGLSDLQEPFTINENPRFAPLWQQGVDAIVDWDDSYIYFFRNPR